MSPPRALPDAAHRERAARVFDRNLVVTAGAGTGKTALLVERALNLIAGAGLPVESIAAITFTDKAAAELRLRLAKALDELRHLARRDARPADPASEAGRAFAWLLTAGRERATIEARALAALTKLDAASVSTIHAFCAEVLRRHPREAGVDPTFRVDEGPAADRLLAEEWPAFLEAELGADAPRPAVWRRALARPGALDAIREIGRGLCSFGVPGRALSSGSIERRASGAPLLQSAIRDALAEGRRLLRDTSGMNRNMQVFLEAGSALLSTCLERGPEAIRAEGSLPAVADFLGLAPPSPGKALSGTRPEVVEAAARRIQDLVRLLSAVDDEATAALSMAALPFAPRFRDKLLKSGLVTFDGLLRLTRDLLEGSPEARASLARRYRTILVDEFQDTDPLQYEILFFIAEAEGPRAQDAYAARLEPGKLFIVGDPKQSIYRFRGADIEAYRRAVSHLLACGGEELTLTASFRSPSEIVGPINAIFRSWIGSTAPGEAAYEPRYDPIDSARGPAGDGADRVAVWSVVGPGDAEERRGAEAEAIAAWIAAHASPGAAGAAYSFRQIGILLRALTHAGLYARALRRAGVPFILEGGKDFYLRPEVGDLTAFLRAVANPNDGASVLAVMRSPLGAIADAELARFVAAGGRLDRPGGGLDDKAAFPGIARTFGLLGSFGAAVRGRAPDEIIRAALRETPLALLHAASFEGPQRLANLRKFVARASVHARAGLSLEETLRALGEEFEAERSEGESPLADETIDAVRILSIHRAKGLEFPVVFVPDLGRASTQAPSSGTRAVWLQGPGEGHLAIRLEDGTTNLAWALHQESSRRHEAAEEKRVFYVACTRARERLILINSNPGRRAPWRDALERIGYRMEGGFPPPGILEAGVRHVVDEPRPSRRPPAPPREEALWAEAAARFADAAASARASASPPIRWPAGAGDARIASLEDRLPVGAAPSARERRPGRDPSRLAGTAVHAALEAWDFRDVSRLRDLTRAEARRLAESEDASGSSRHGFARRLLETAGQIVDEFLRTPLPGRLAAAHVLGREMPILFRDEAGATWIGACDLVYRDRDGTLVAADYKTDRIEGVAEEAAERYRPQMAVYLAALRRALPGERLRGEILFLRTGAVVRLDVSPITLSEPAPSG